MKKKTQPIEDLYLSLYNTRNSLNNYKVKPKEFVTLDNALSTCLKVVGDAVSNEMQSQINDLLSGKK